MIELMCTLAGAIAGIAGYASLVHYRGDRDKFETRKESLDGERIRSIVDQLKMISNRVAADVSAHNRTVGDLAEQLSDEEEPAPEKIISTIAELISANHNMQGQLADAQEKIDKQTKLIEQASEQARTDALTGLPNRRALDEFLENCLSTANENTREAFGVMLMDIDHFKNFNDSFGHATGDAVLASFARSITEVAGRECYCSRYGGEEFAVVITGDNDEDLSIKAANIRKFISEQIINHEDLQLQITASAGLCPITPGADVAAVYEKADEGLYQSKKQGRDQGHWLASEGWVPFPAVDGITLEDYAKSKPPAPTPSETLPETDNDEEFEPEDQATSSESSNVEPSEANLPADSGSDQPTEDDAVEILDLNTFSGRLKAYLDQLRMAELPSCAFMVEAVGLDAGNPQDEAAGWEATVALVQLNLRGIDVVCLYRPKTICVFMPGCSQDAALDRITNIMASLDNVRDNWVAGTCPERFSIGVASAKADEDGPVFLDRLESTLEDAQDCSSNEVAIHDGDVVETLAIDPAQS